MKRWLAHSTRSCAVQWPTSLAAVKYWMSGVTLYAVCAALYCRKIRDTLCNDLLTREESATWAAHCNVSRPLQTYELRRETGCCITLYSVSAENQSSLHPLPAIRTAQHNFKEACQMDSISETGRSTGSQTHNKHTNKMRID